MDPRIHQSFTLLFFYFQPLPTPTHSNLFPVFLMHYPLHVAILNNQFGKVKSLLTSAYDVVEERTREGFTALMLCCKLNNVRLVKLLLGHKASLDAVDNIGATALMISSEQGNLQVVNVLVKAGADLHVKDMFGKSALYLAAEQERLEIVVSLLEAGASPCSAKNDGMMPLHTAARHGRLEVVKALVGGGASLSTSVMNRDGLCVHDLYVPLDMACIGGHIEIVRWILSHGLETCGGHTRGYQAFQVASFFGRVDLLELLAQEGIRDRGAALIFGTFGSKQESVKFLLNQLKESAEDEDHINSRVNYRDARGRTALIMAVGKSNLSPKMVRWLIESGADTSVRVEYKDGRVPSNGTLLEWTTKLMVGETEENVQKLKAIRRVLMQEDAVHSNSWSWPAMNPLSTGQVPKKNKSRTTSLVVVRGVMRGLLRYSGKPDE